MQLETQTVWIAPSELSHINIKSFEKREGVIVLSEGEFKKIICDTFFAGCKWFNSPDTDFIKAQTEYLDQLIKP